VKILDYGGRVVRDAERNCRIFEPFISRYPLSNANPDTASIAFEAFGRAKEAPKFPDPVDQASSVSDASHRPKNRRIEAVVSTAVSLVVITSIGLMAVLLSPQNKSAATHDVSDAARLDAHRVGLGRTNAENIIGTNDASPVESIGADESTPPFVTIQAGRSAKQIASTEFISYWMTVSTAKSTEAEIRNLPMQRKSEDKLQSAIRELLMRSANATSHRDPGISTQ
jgi:hypothetical protein